MNFINKAGLIFVICGTGGLTNGEIHPETNIPTYAFIVILVGVFLFLLPEHDE